MSQSPESKVIKVAGDTVDLPDGRTYPADKLPWQEGSHGKQFAVVSVGPDRFWMFERVKPAIQ